MNVMSLLKIVTPKIGTGGFCCACLCQILFFFFLPWQFIGATMGSSELQIQSENGQIGMPSNICCVVVEYCPGGALKSYLIKNRRRKLAFKVVVQLALDLARGLDLYTQSFLVLLFFET